MNLVEEYVNEEKISKLVELWKNYDGLEFKMQNKFIELQVILKWMILVIEIKIKQNAIQNSRDKMNKAQDDLNDINVLLKNINSEILTIKLNMKRLKFSLNKAISQLEEKENVDKISIEPKNTLLGSITKNKSRDTNNNLFGRNKKSFAHDSLNNTCNNSELDEKPRIKVSVDYDAFTKNLFSHAFKDVKDNVSSNKAEKPLPIQGRIYKLIKHKGIINEMPQFKTKNNQSVLNSWNSSSSLIENKNDDDESVHLIKKEKSHRMSYKR
jgi:hypothetical protein